MNKIIGAVLFAGIASTAVAQTLSQSSNSPTALSAHTNTASTSLIVTGQHLFTGATAVTGTAGFIMIWDASSEPADGVVSPGFCYPIPAPTTSGAAASMANTPNPVQSTNGIVVSFSTGADCFHKVASPSYLVINYQ